MSCARSCANCRRVRALRLARRRLASRACGSIASSRCSRRLRDRRHARGRRDGAACASRARDRADARRDPAVDRSLRAHRIARDPGLSPSAPAVLCNASGVCAIATGAGKANAAAIGRGDRVQRPARSERDVLRDRRARADRSVAGHDELGSVDPRCRRRRHRVGDRRAHAAARLDDRLPRDRSDEPDVAAARRVRHRALRARYERWSPRRSRCRAASRSRTATPRARIARSTAAAPRSPRRA